MSSNNNKINDKEFNIYAGEKPKILLLGNGLNRISGQCSWDGLLDAIKDNEMFSASAKDYSIPMSLKAPMLCKGAVNNRIKDYISREFNNVYTCSSKKVLEILSDYVNVPFDYILTTNYSYEIEMAMQCKVKLRESAIKRMTKHTLEVTRAEGKYLLSTYNTPDRDGKRQVWHIHGEYRKPSGMIIGQYYYGNLIYKYKELLDKRVKSFIKNIKYEKPESITSWLDAFMLGDLYIVGLGLDFAETDLWWLLEKKMLYSEKILTGKTIYYSPKVVHNKNSKCFDCSCDKECYVCNRFDDNKFTGTSFCHNKMLEIYGVESRNLNFIINSDGNGNGSYEDFYRKVLNDIKQDIINTR